MAKTKQLYTQAELLRAAKKLYGNRTPVKKTATTFKKTLKEIMYCYLEPANAAFAKQKKAQGLIKSCSAYVNGLIAKDRGVKTTTAVWGSKTKSTSSTRKA